MVLRRWVGGCACGALLALGGAAEAEAAVSVYPGDGTPDVSPRTQITLRGEPASALAGLVVTGSRSGRHSGSLRPDPDGQGASFFPSRSFVDGERVTVRPGPPVNGVPDGTVTFTVERYAPSAPPIFHLARPKRRPGDVQRFRSRPDLAPPGVRVVAHTV